MAIFEKKFIVSAGRDPDPDPGPNVNIDLVQLNPDSVKMTKFDQIQINNIAVRGHLSHVINFPYFLLPHPQIP